MAFDYIDAIKTLSPVPVFETDMKEFLKKNKLKDGLKIKAVGLFAVDERKTQKLKGINNLPKKYIVIEKSLRHFDKLFTLLHEIGHAKDKKLEKRTKEEAERIADDYAIKELNKITKMYKNYFSPRK